MCEAIPRQVNYLIDEASDVGKGASTTISYVHHHFQNHGLGETRVHLHADNCSGQNKNNFFLWYLAWRTILQLHDSIRYSFLIAGHTKFGPDRCFGIIKRSYKVSYVSSLYEFANMVEGVQHCWSQHSSACWNTRWESNCVGVQLVSVPGTVLYQGSQHKEVSPFQIFERRTW